MITDEQIQAMRSAHLRWITTSGDNADNLYVAIAEAYEQSKWRTDFDAVKDGTKIRIYDGYVQAEVSFRELGGRWKFHDEHGCSYEPTHYQLLPTPPKE